MSKGKYSEFTFWYPVEVAEQPDFEGHIHKIEVLLEGHILYGGRFLCHQTMEVVKNSVKATKDKAVSTPAKGVKLCRKCQERYKIHPASPWMKWVNGTPEKVETREVTLISGG